MKNIFALFSLILCTFACRQYTDVLQNAQQQLNDVLWRINSVLEGQNQGGQNYGASFEASKKFFAHLLIQRDAGTENLYECPGAVIDEYWVLTSATCLIWKEFRSIQGEFGGIEIFRMPVVRNAIKVVIHKDYGEFTISKFMDSTTNTMLKINYKLHDLALIKLNESLHFHQNTDIAPVRMSKEPVDYNMMHVTYLGFNDANGTITDFLQMQDVTLLPNEEVNRYVTDKKAVPYLLQGYSYYTYMGAPLLDNGMLVGLTISRCKQAQDIYFSRISAYVEWISYVISKHKDMDLSTTIFRE